MDISAIPIKIGELIHHKIKIAYCIQLVLHNEHKVDIFFEKERDGMNNRGTGSPMLIDTSFLSYR